MPVSGLDERHKDETYACPAEEQNQRGTTSMWITQTTSAPIATSYTNGVNTFSPFSDKSSAIRTFSHISPSLKLPS